MRQEWEDSSAVGNISVLVADMLLEIPETEQELIAQLKDSQGSARCAAPETMVDWWTQTYWVLVANLPEIPTEDWQFSVLSIFSTEPVEALKKRLVPIEEQED